MMYRALSQRTFSAPIQKNRRGYSTLVLGEHDNSQLLPSTLSAVTAAKQLGKEVNILLAGSFKDAGAISKQAAAIAGVNRVLVANNAQYEHATPER
jgi:electron transfer flavoprotein alpha subunit